MSNATQDSRNPGDSRRRRSRGGKNRRNNHNGNNSNQEQRRDGQNDRGQQHQGRRQQGGGRSDEFRPNHNASRPARKYAPVKLTLWQKFLKMIGLYKEPVHSPRKPEDRTRTEEPRAPKSNVRVARGGSANDESSSAPTGEKRQRQEKGDRPERSERRSRGGDRDSVESARVYVGNLSYDVTEQDLQELFKGIGGVRSVEIVYNRSTHRSKGYGFVELYNVDEAKRSVEVLHDQFFMGRKLLVSGAKSKGQDEREDKEERSERQPRPVVVAPVVAAAPVVETVTPLEDVTPEVAIEAAVENVAAAGAPEVIVEAVEHAVTEAVEEEAPAPAATAAAAEETPVAEEQKEKPAEA